MLRKTAIITGAFGGIGKATAEKFAQNGYNVALTYLNTFDTDFIDKLKSYGVEVLALRCDQQRENDIINFVNSVFNEFEFVDAFVGNAGTSENSDLLTQKTTETIDMVLDTNLRGTIIFNREILKHFMQQKHGNIVNVSSIYALFGGSLESTYSASKAGIVGLTKSLSIEAAPLVRVNAVAPGYIETKMTAGLSTDAKEYVKNQTPLARLGKPEDVANAVYFLASDEASFITGEVLVVSGGAVLL
ncbi:MAG: SDR family oxidoreductase [Clostridia bacterium]|nr:SDR family oxidoreductase [Clostridia bacterium]